MGMVAERRAAAEKLLSDAATVRAEAEAQANAVRQRRQGISAEGERMLTEARAVAETERARLLQQAADAAAHTRDAAQAALANDARRWNARCAERACDLAIAIARRLLRLAWPAAATAALLEAVGSAVTELPEEQRRDLAASAARSMSSPPCRWTPASRRNAGTCSAGCSARRPPSCSAPIRR